MARSQQEYNFIQNECTHIGETVSHSVGMVQIVEKCKEIRGGTLPGLEGALVGKGTEAEIKESVAAFGLALRVGKNCRPTLRPTFP